MEGVLEALLGILTPAAASMTADSSLPTENHLPNTQSAVVAEQPVSNHAVTSVNSDEVTEKSIQSHFNSDIGDSHKTAEDLSNRVSSSTLHSAGSENVKSMDVNFASIETSDSHDTLPQPQNNAPLSSSNVILDSSLMNSAAVAETENVDGVITTEESLTHSLPLLSEMPLTVPVCPPRYLKLSFLPDETIVSRVSHFYHFNEFYF